VHQLRLGRHTPSPSRAVLGSFFQDQPEEGYTTELWDTQLLAPICVEIGNLGPPPMYKFVLSKRDIEEDPLGTGRVGRPVPFSCFGGVLTAVHGPYSAY
jgi:hypothetical protein